MPTEKYIVYLCSIHEKILYNGDLASNELFLIEEDYPGRLPNKRFFPDFNAAKEFDSYEEALKDTFREATPEAIKNALNNFLFIDIHPRYRYAD